MKGLHLELNQFVLNQCKNKFLELKEFEFEIIFETLANPNLESPNEKFHEKGLGTFTQSPARNPIHNIDTIVALAFLMFRAVITIASIPR